MKIWIRVGMEADITIEELEKIKNGDEETMKSIIQKAELSGETYVPDCDYNEDIYGNEKEFEYIEFVF